MARQGEHLAKRRHQIETTDEPANAMIATAAARNMSVAALVRAAIEAYIADDGPSGDAA